MFSSHFDFPPVDGLPNQEKLPDPFIGPDGKRVQSIEEWPAQREYLKAMLRHYMHGHMPPFPDPDQVIIKQTFSQPAFDGLSIEEHITLTITRDKKHVDLDVVLYRPPEFKPYPTIIKNCCHQFSMDTASISQLVARHPSLVEEYIQEDLWAAHEANKRGYMLCKFQREQLALDIKDSPPNGVQRLYPEYDWGVIAIWAWGHGVVMEALARMEKTVATGISRGGCVAVTAGIFDERISVVAPCHGNIQAGGSFRILDPDGVHGTEEYIETDYKPRVPYWNPPRFHEFAGRINKLPFDGHTLVALIAPRPYLNTSSTEDDVDNPLSMEVGIRVGQIIYDWMDRRDWCRLHWCPGTHGQYKPDWRALLDYCDEYFFGKRGQSAFNQWRYPDFTAPLSWEAPNAGNSQ